jgi:hypothetical protein
VADDIEEREGVKAGRALSGWVVGLPIYMSTHKERRYVLQGLLSYQVSRTPVANNRHGDPAILINVRCSSSSIITFGFAVIDLVETNATIRHHCNDRR